MTLQTFLLGLMIVSTLTALLTEALKKVFQEMKVSYYPNALAGYSTVSISIAVGVAYIVLTNARLNAEMIVYLVALIFLSWLSAMVGYDKVIQAIAQFRKE